MPLPEPNLDDLRFQRDLVDEARLRIIRYCPEWTEYNVSDPGITLIELFAWMTEQIVYRLNRVPEKNYIRFLDMVGVQLLPSSSAHAELTFRLSIPFPIRPEDETVALVPQGIEVATLTAPDSEEVIFTTDRPLIVVPPKLSQLRGADFQKNYFPRMGIEIFHPFNQTRPQQGDTFYLGFDETHDISGHILRLRFECERTEAVGIRREDPPLVWECTTGDGRWEEILPSKREGEKDTTGGLNNETGELTFYLPLSMQKDEVYGRTAYWVRCRLEQRNVSQGMYTRSPRIRRVEAFSLGATVPSTNAVYVVREELGVSEGEAGQSFSLQNAPVLDLRAEERVEVEEQRDGELVFIPWERVTDFAKSDRFDRHFTLETATGEVAFGPSVRQADGSVIQYGRVPEVGRRVRMSQYRYGGGSQGNVPANRIQVMRSAVPYISQVTNLRRSIGGRDQESLEEAKLRARRELRAQHRAVTAEDFEDLALATSRRIARVKSLAPGTSNGNLPPGMIELLVVPAVRDSVAVGDLSKLALQEELMQESWIIWTVTVC
ncbi:MAG: putative baseplate assembly protein [Caldilineaceae bacterium]|nr:putative baseplate assembly protein [Caldilineaceae bacterium]